MPVLSKRALLVGGVVTVIYLLLAVYLRNYSFVLDTLFGSYPVMYKLTIFVTLLGGLWTSMTLKALIMLCLTAALTGLNIGLLTEKFGAFRSDKGLAFTLGGSSLGILGAGCASCGLPVLALLGFSGSLVNLPLQGMEFSYLALGMLLLSCYVLLKNQNQSCQLVIAERAPKI